MEKIKIVGIPEDEYKELLRKSKEYDKMTEWRRKGANTINNISAEARRERAKKAVETRIKKYNQKTRKAK